MASPSGFPFCHTFLPCKTQNLSAVPKPKHSTSALWDCPTPQQWWCCHKGPAMSQQPQDMGHIIKAGQRAQNCNPTETCGMQTPLFQPHHGPTAEVWHSPGGTRRSAGFRGDLPADRLCASCRVGCHRRRTLQIRAPPPPTPTRPPRPRRRTTTRRTAGARSASTSARSAPARAGTASARCACGTGAWARPCARAASGPRATPTPSTWPCTTRCRTASTTASAGGRGAGPSTWDATGPGTGGEGDP